MGQASGTDGLKDTPKKHFAPDQCIGAIEYADGLRAQLISGPFAPHVTNEDRTNVHKRIAAYGTRGYVHWTMWSWEVGIDGHIERGTHEYPDEDILGQAAMTDAMLQWIEDAAKVHPLNLDLALRDFNIILGIYTSALEHRPVELPCEPADGSDPCLANAPLIPSIIRRAFFTRKSRLDHRIQIALRDDNQSDSWPCQSHGHTCTVAEP